MTYRFTDLLPAGFSDAALREDVRKGLTDQPKWLPPKWFYDKTGSALFEDITRLPEYYPTRSERSILTAHGAAIVRAAQAGHLVELGSGSAEKARLLLSDQTDYTAMDVSESALRQAAQELSQRYPDLRIEAVRADFEQNLTEVLRGCRGDRLIAFLGGTIGNLQPAQRTRFLAALRAGMRDGDAFLLGADLVKSPELLVPAYDDAAGVTAAFDLNLLSVLNHRLGADFRPEDFRHRAVWNEPEAWIEMRLRAGRDLTVRFGDLDLSVRLERGEEIRTEISAKFTRAGLEKEMAVAGFGLSGWWTDPRGWFSLSLWRP